MDFKKVKVPVGGKLFKVYNFTYIFKGSTYLLEVDEFQDGSYSGHGEQATDKSTVVESVSGKSLNECLENLLKKIESRS